MNDTEAILQSCDLFRGLSAPTIKALAAMGRRARYAGGDRIAAKEPFVGLIAAGDARVEKDSSDGRRIVLRHLLAGDVFGLAALYCPGSELSRIIAAKECEVIIYSRADIEAMFVREPQIAARYIAYLSGRIAFLTHKIEGFAGSSAKGRLASFLYDHARQNGSGGGEIDLPVSFSELADVLGAARASLYRALDAREAEGVISRRGRRITIADLTRLAESV